MLWSKEDFEREVRRQLVELESIRKRIPDGDDVHRKIDLLEESQRNLIRKLGEFFDTGSAGALRSAPAAGVARSAARPEAPRRRRSRRTPSSFSGEPAAMASIRALALRRRRRRLPPIQEKCASCGKALISSILFGAEVVFEDDGWHHKACRKSSRSPRPSALN